MWLHHLRDMTHSYTSDSFLCVTWHIRMCATKLFPRKKISTENLFVLSKISFSNAIHPVDILKRQLHTILTIYNDSKTDFSDILVTCDNTSDLTRRDASCSDYVVCVCVCVCVCVGGVCVCMCVVYVCVYVCGSHSYECRDSFVYVNSFTCVSWLIHMCAAWVPQDDIICLSLESHPKRRVGWLLLVGAFKMIGLFCKRALQKRYSHVRRLSATRWYQRVYHIQKDAWGGYN